MNRIVLRKPKKRRRKSRKYGRGQPSYIKSNRIYRGKIHRGRGIGQVKNLLRNLVGKVLGLTKRLVRHDENEHDQRDDVT